MAMDELLWSLPRMRDLIRLLEKSNGSRICGRGVESFYIADLYRIKLNVKINYNNEIMKKKSENFL